MIDTPLNRSAKLIWEASPKGVRFQIVEPALLGRGKPLAVTAWGLLKGQAALAGASMLLAWIDAGNEDWLDGADAVLVPHPIVAELGPIEAGRLGLPKPTPFLLDVGHAETLDHPKFSFRAEWRDSSNRKIIGVERTGAIITYGNQRYLLTNPLFSVVETIAEFNADPPADKDQRLAAWGRIRADLIGMVGAPIKVGDYLKSINVLSAAAISLCARITQDGFRFDPLLYGRCIAKPDPRAEDDRGAESSDEGSSAFGRLLPEGLEKRFAEIVLPRDGPRSRYVLDDGLFIITGNIVKKALEIVATVNRADAPTRNAFAINPRPFFVTIADEMGLAVDDFLVDAGLFSDRVIGLGDWRRRSLGWLQKSGEVWLPDEEPHAIPVGNAGQSLIVVPEDVFPLSQKIQEALDLGQTEIEWRGSVIPANAELLAEVGKVTGLLRPTSPEKPAEPETSKPARGKRVGLTLKENEEELTFLREARAHDRSLEGTDVRDGLKTTLKRHQVEGVRWLQACYLQGSRGALLADDMGLGKTLIVLAFLSWLRRGIEISLSKQGRATGTSRPPTPFLVVAPTSLLGNWETEERTHLNESGRLGRLIRAYGPHLKELRLTKGKDVEISGQALDRNRIADADWVLTTYETLSDYHLSFATIPFVAVVFDETQKVKTPLIPITDAAKSVRSAFAIAMTGTPVENRLADLWTIMDVIWPGQLAASLKDFVGTYEKATDEARFEELFALLTQPRGELPPLMLRRMKEDELDGLPKRQEIVIKTTMAPEQASAFQAVVDSSRGSGGRDIMRVLQHMRGISLHPSPQDQTDERVYIDRSARLTAALEILDAIHEKDEKALIFVESRQIQPYLALLLERRYAMPRRPMTINGSTMPAQRTKIVETFQAARGFDVLILGPKSAGVGFTLTAANHAIHLSRWWNPAVEDQCSDRIYRMSQTRPVTIYYLLAIHPAYGDESFDVKLHNLLRKKRDTSRRLLQPMALTHEELSDLWRSAAYGSNGAWTPSPQSNEPSGQFEEMDWQGFEEWVLQRLKERGYQANRTPRSGDGGADGVFLKFGPNGGAGLIQCKHTGNPDLVQDDAAIRNLIEARSRYALKNPRLIAITNANRFSMLAQSKAAMEAVELFTRADLLTFHEAFD